jgi:hypothetical protein
MFIVQRTISKVEIVAQVFVKTTKNVRKQPQLYINVFPTMIVRRIVSQITEGVCWHGNPGGNLMIYIRAMLVISAFPL